jgi:hypothetical protein
MGRISSCSVIGMQHERRAHRALPAGAIASTRSSCVSAAVNSPSTLLLASWLCRSRSDTIHTTTTSSEWYTPCSVQVAGCSVPDVHPCKESVWQMSCLQLEVSFQPAILTRSCWDRPCSPSAWLACDQTADLGPCCYCYAHLCTMHPPCFHTMCTLVTPLCQP